MDRLTKAITSHRRAVIAVFLALALICAVLMLGVSVNYKLADYLPPDAESTVALGILNDEFGSGIPNTRVMVSGLTLAEAEALKSGIAAVDGVTGVMWLDDVEDLSTPVEADGPGHRRAVLARRLGPLSGDGGRRAREQHHRRAL